MILSILDTDLYKFSTSNAYFQLYPLAEGTFRFNDRAGERYGEDFLEMLKEEVASLGALSMTDEEFTYVCRRVRYIPRNYWEWLRGFRFSPEKIRLSLDGEGHLEMEVTDLMYKVTLYEVPLLAIVAELRNRFLGVSVDTEKAISILRGKLEYATRNALPFSERAAASPRSSMTGLSLPSRRPARIIAQELLTSISPRNTILPR